MNGNNEVHHSLPDVPEQFAVRGLLTVSQIEWFPWPRAALAKVETNREVETRGFRVTSGPLVVPHDRVAQNTPVTALCCGLISTLPPPPWPRAPSGWPPTQSSFPHGFSRRNCILSGLLRGLELHRKLVDDAVHHFH